MPKGKYIVLEGGEGVGKDTQAQLLINELIGRGLPAEFVEEPGGDAIGLVLRSILKKDPDDQRLMRIMGGTDYLLLPKTELLLFNAARVQTLELIRQKLDAGSWVVCGRNFLSTLAYQCYGRGLDLEAGRAICSFAVEGLQPDLMLLLDAPAAETERRRAVRQQTDQFEAAGRGFHENVNAGYRREAEACGMPIVDAAGSVQEVHARIWKYVTELLEEK